MNRYQYWKYILTGCLFILLFFPEIAHARNAESFQEQGLDPKANGQAMVTALSNNGIQIPGSPLNIIVYDNGSVALQEAGKNHFYGSNASGMFLWSGDSVFGPDVPAGLSHNALTAVSHSGPTGLGTNTVPWVVHTTFRVGSTGIEVEQKVSYVNGARDVGFSWTLYNRSNLVSPEVVLFHAADLYVDGNDYGIGYFNPTNHSIGGYNQNTGIYGIFTPLTPPDAYEESGYYAIWNRIGSTNRGIGFQNLIRSGFIDNGAGLQWNLGALQNNSSTNIQSRFSVAPLDTSGITYEIAPTQSQINHEHQTLKLREFEFGIKVGQTPDDYHPGPFTFAIPISRYYGNLFLNGTEPQQPEFGRNDPARFGQSTNLNKPQLVAPRSQISLRAFDIDGHSENLRLYINRKSPTDCETTENVIGLGGGWSTVNISFRSDCLNFPTLPNDPNTGKPINLHDYTEKYLPVISLVPESNEFELRPSLETQQGKILIAWAKLRVGGVRPVLFSHGINPGLSITCLGSYRSIGQWEKWIYDSGLPGLGALVDGSIALDTQIVEWDSSYYEMARLFGLRVFETGNIIEPDRIIAVGHSMGGLMARGFTHEKHSEGHYIVDQLAAYGTPNQGANIARATICSNGARASLLPDNIKDNFNPANDLTNSWAVWSQKYDGSNNSREHFFAFAGRYDGTQEWPGNDFMGDDVVSVGNVHSLNYDTDFRYYWAADYYPSVRTDNIPTHLGSIIVLHEVLPTVGSMFDRITALHPNYLGDNGLAIGRLVDPLIINGDNLAVRQSGSTTLNAQSLSPNNTTNSATNLQEEQIIKQFTGQMDLSGSYRTSFYVDESSELLLRPIPYAGYENFNVKLQSPDGTVHTGNNIIGLENPLTGTWTITLSANNGTSYALQAETKSNLEIVLSDQGRIYTTPGSVVLLGLRVLDDQVALQNLAVNAAINLPDGSVQFLALNDAGENGDSVANDGVYSVNYQTDAVALGEYFVEYQLQGSRTNGSTFERYTTSSILTMIGDRLLETPVSWVPQDKNGDGLFDTIQSDVAVQVAEPGRYNLIAGLYNTIDGTMVGRARTDFTIGNQQMGITQQISLTFAGDYLKTLNRNLNLQLADVKLYQGTDNTLIDYAEHPFGELALTSDSLQESMLNVKVEGYGLKDNDNNGLANFLTFTTTIFSRFGGNYTIQATLQDSLGTSVAFARFAQILRPGVQSLSVEFDALQIVGNGVDGTFTLGNLLLIPLDAKNSQMEIWERANLLQTDHISLSAFEGVVKLLLNSNVEESRAYVRVNPANVNLLYASGSVLSLEPVIVAPGVAFDKWVVNGESRNEVPLQLTLDQETVVEAIFKAPQMHLVVEPSQIPADGISSANITVIVTDVNGAPMSGLVVSFTTSLGTIATTGITDDMGKVLTRLTSAITPGIASVVISTNWIRRDLSVEFTPNAPESLLLFSNNSLLIANGISTTVLSAQVINSSGNPVPGQIVQFLSSDGLFMDTVITSNSGVAKTTYKVGTETGAISIIASTTSLSNTVTFEVVAGPPSSLYLSADVSSLIADGQSSTGVNATVTDAYGNVVPQQTVIFSTTLGTITQSNITDISGNAHALLTVGTTAGNARVYAVVADVAANIDISFKPVNIEPLIVSLQMQTIGNGSVTISKPGPYPSGTQIQLTAVPDSGWRFVRWESTESLGDQTNLATITVTVSKDATYTAYFEPDEEPNDETKVYLPLINR